MEEISRLQGYEPLWGEWKVDSLMCEGNLANVYVVKNESATAVIKVISVPKLQLEGRMASQSSAENQEAMSGFFKEVVTALENEMERISVVDSIPNVLSYRKYEAFERKTEIGYDLVLLMDKEESLQEYIAARPHIKNDEIVKIVKEIAWILDRAHKEGILHKDIKLENIFIGENGESMLADFALARKIESYQSRLQRKVDSTYVAPEVLSEYDYSEETDVYALGMVLYILLNDGNVPSEIARRTFNTDIPKPVRAGNQLAAITQKAISYRARDRYRSAEEFFKALSALQAEDFALPVDYVSQAEMKRNRALEKERLRREEEERKAEEERLRREAEERKAEEDRLRREEEERKAEEDRLRREAEERKAEEDRLRREEEERRVEEERQRREAEERRVEEERQRREEEERQAEEERQRREAEERRAEEERLRREEEQRRAEEEKRLRREEEERRAEEERLRREEEECREEERLRREEEERRAEEERLKREAEERKAEEERLRREAEEQRRKLEESAKELEQRVQGMAALVKDAKFDADGREIYDRDAEARKDFTDYSPEYNEEKLDEVFEQITKEKEKEESFDNSTLLGKIEELDSTPEFHIHSDAAEYSGFFDFEKEAYQEEEKEKKLEYDKSIDEEPFEQRMAEFPKKTVGKTPFIQLFILLLLLAAGVFCWQNKEIRGKIQEMYLKVTAAIEEQMDSFSERTELQLPEEHI